MNTIAPSGGIAAIPTRYKGYHFRSRLEARWAVYFDAIGCLWEYEPQGYGLLDGSLYLPDFMLKTVSMWAEVKPTWPTNAELVKAAQLVLLTGRSVLFLDGPPDYKNYWALTPTATECICGDSECTSCSGPVKGTEWNDYYITDWHFNESRFFGCTGDGFGGDRGAQECCDWPPWADAVNAAKSARFEHGESGRT